MMVLPEKIQIWFGIAELSEETLEDCLARVKIRLAAVDLAGYRRLPAQARLRSEAIDSMIGALRDHLPNHNIQVRNGWPAFTITLKGTSARVEPHLGIEYDTGDGIEPFDVTVRRAVKPNWIENLKKRLASRVQPPLELTKVAPPEEPPKRQTRTDRARSILDAGKR